MLTSVQPLAARASDRSEDRELAAVVIAARSGHAPAWEQLVQRLEPMLRQIARSYRLAPPDVEDAMQEAWLGLLTDIERLREPAAVAGWLATAMRRLCLRALQPALREVPTDGGALDDRPDDEDGPVAQLLAAERREVLARGLAVLPERHRDLMVLLASDPSPSYEEAGAALGMPVGSIGPIRARSLARLARNPALRALGD